MVNDNYYDKIDENIAFSHFKGQPNTSQSFHLHDCFEIYFFICGKVKYFIEKKVYDLDYGDLLIMNSAEVHKPLFLSNDTYERIVIHFDPSLARQFSSPDFNLLGCFFDRPKGEQNRLCLGRNHSEDLLRLLGRMEALQKNPVKGSEILKLAIFIEILVHVNHLFRKGSSMEEHPCVPEKLAPVLDFIENNLENDLSLELMEQKLYMNRFYLSRLFKQYTGMNIHKYIIFKRLSKAMKLLSEGSNVTYACQMSGFNDYSHFSRMFKTTVGISPGEFKKDRR